MSSSEWRAVKLGDVCEFQKGFAFKSKDYQDSGRKIVKVSDLNDYSVDFSGCICIDETKVEDYTKYSLKHDDIIITTVGSWPSNPNSVVGKVVRVQKEVGGALLNQNAVRVRATNVLCQRYVFHCLKNKDFFDYIVGTAQGAANQASITQSDIKSYEFLLPSISEQKSIAATLSCLDDKIELNNRMNKTQEEMAQAIFKSWFVDFEPFQDGEFEESELGMIPKGWRYDSLYEVFDVIYGAAYKSKLFNEERNGFPLIRIRDLKTFSPQFYTEEKHPKTEFVDLGDILVGMDAEFRPCIWRGKQGVLNQRVCKFVPKYKHVSNYFIYATIKPHMEFIENFKVGTTVSHIGKGDIDKIKVLIPPIEVLEKFKSIIDPIYNRILINSVESGTLSEIRDTLLPKLMSGEISVPIKEVQ